MIKNGLFLASIGMLILMFSVSRETFEYDMLNLTTALFMIIFGGVLAYKGTKKEKAKEEVEK
ncbi:DUF3188 domain-containing protein [Carnobacterium sp. TMP28]|uniref:DUF3188 domain-containing protein n=1 Tax=Carnobacterium sp. TMP28 TaxID=3397060 RepID=UPI0039E1A520